ncbi:NAD-dependent epimerase/dehydratase family protein [Pelagibacterium montanilacus]|uniref:NAD-dependent epimerase/dehydratase family protein n=1 Tax=Pelagibacterium montanilacus TaxID=2185280 RepID=UPI000F8EAFCF|nr:NAD(P)-dependent oxidoreductase [Pelagibacterium montanilacus]
MKRILITGAAGGVATLLRSRIAHLADAIRLTDVFEVAGLGANEEFMACDLGDEVGMARIVAGCDGIVHLGGVAKENTFANIMNANLLGVYNLYEAARANGLPRIVFASTNHTIGFYGQDERLHADVPTRPDGLYGVSKCFGEQMARMYFHKFGQQTAIVRIGSLYEAPSTHRMLASWFSPDDFASLIETAFSVPRLGCPVVWGASDNDEGWWDNSAAGYLGWVPIESSRRFREDIRKTVPRPPADAAESVYQGGTFTQDPIWKDEEPQA